MIHREYEWKVVMVSLHAPEDVGEPDALELALNALERAQWDVFQVLADPTQLSARVIARRPLRGASA